MARIRRVSRCLEESRKEVTERRWTTANGRLWSVVSCPSSYWSLESVSHTSHMSRIWVTLGRTFANCIEFIMWVVIKSLSQ